MKQAASSALLIPIRLRAALSGKQPEKNIWSDYSYDFTQLGDPYAVIEKPLFSQTGGRAPGVYLHWSLPSCFTQGIQEDDTKDITYRLAPNRWAVIRIWIPDSRTDAGGDFQNSSPDRQDAPQKAHVKTFLVESDVLNRTPSEEFSTGPSWPWPEDPAQPFRFLGRAFPMEKEVLPADSHIRLTAVSPVSPFFAAYAPACDSVFSFYDDLPAEGLEHINLTYLVCGWYQEDGEPEPFKEIESWDELEAAFGLTGDSPALPSRTLCHGLLDQIHWINGNTLYHSGIPDDPEPGTVSEMPVIGAGNNSSEALAALMAGNDTGEAERLMTLMLQNLEQDLDRRQGLIKAEEDLHHTKFGVEQTIRVTGIHKIGDSEDITRDKWTAKPDSSVKPESSGNSGCQESTAPPSSAFMEQLSALRQMQRDLWQHYAVFLQKQREIYENWYLHLYSDPPYDSIYFKAASLSIEDAHLQMNALKQEAEAVTLEKDRLRLPDGYEFFDEREEPFYIPTEPSLVLSQSAPVNGPLTDTEDSPLFCRVSGEAVTGLSLTGVAGKTVDLSGEELLSNVYLSPLVPDDLKEEIDALISEAVVLSTGFSLFLAGQAFAKAGITPSGEALALLKTRIEAAQNCGGRTNPLVMGTLPDSCALNRFAPCWYPLILEWQANYYPDMKLLSEAPDLGRWELVDGDYLYVCTQKPDPVITADNAYPVQGRLFISNHAQMTVQSLVKRRFAGQENLKQAVRSTDRLSQALDGFNSFLLMKEHDLPPAFFLRSPEEQAMLDLISELDGSLLGDRPVFDGLFSPIRGGFLSLSRLRIVDALGRFQDIFYPDLYASENFLAPGAENPVHHLMLPPRLVQPSRLSAQFLKTGGTALTESSFPLSATPVCGFLLPNLLDHSIVVYYPDGTPAGSLNLVETGTGIRFDSPPGKPRSTEIPADLDPDIRAFLCELSAAGPKALQELVEYISGIQLYTQPPSHTPEDIEYIGKPLAMVRLLTRLELYGDAEKYRHADGGEIPDKTGRANVRAARFPMEAGNLKNPADGLAGFFEDGDYSRFHVYPELSGSLSSPYFVSGHRVHLSPDSKAPAKILTLLLDPWSDITLTTGILPVRTLSIPRELVAEALQNIEVTFFSSPILTGSEEITIPVPHSDEIAFFWEAAQADGSWKTDLILYQDGQSGDLTEQIHIADGYIRIRSKDREEEKHAFAE